MGKIIKKHDNGKAARIEFKDDKSISLVVEGTKIKLIEIGLMDMEVGTICTKDVQLYDQLVEVLLKCEDIGSARVRANIVKLPSAGGGEAEVVKGDLPYERNTKLKHFDIFKKITELVSSGQGMEKMTVELEQAKDAVKESATAYCDNGNQNHKQVVGFIEAIPMTHPLMDDKDRLWIFKEIFAKLAGMTGVSETDEGLRYEFREFVKLLKGQVGAQFYRPVSYPSDFDAAEELLHAAENYENMGKMSDAMSMVEQAIGAAFNCLDAYYKLAEYSILQRDYDAAVQALERISDMPLADKVLPTRADYFVLFGKLCKKIQDSTAATQHLEKLKSIAAKYQIPIEQPAG